MIWEKVLSLLRREFTVDTYRPDSDVPEAAEFCCPITLCRFVHPVVATDGHTYERSALIKHVVANGFISPLTREPLGTDVFENRAVTSVMQNPGL